MSPLARAPEGTPGSPPRGGRRGEAPAVVQAPEEAPVVVVEVAVPDAALLTEPSTVFVIARDPAQPSPPLLRSHPAIQQP